LTPDVRLHLGDCLDVLRSLPDASARCCVTSPPYYGLRDYGVDGQIGLEETPDAYVSRLVEVFAEVRRVLTPDGTLWLNLGDSYASTAPGTRNGTGTGLQSDPGRIAHRPDYRGTAGIKPKDLIGIPWRVAFALQSDGWYLRSDIIWHKPNPMPESVRDRPTKAHEYVFLLSKAPRYYYDAGALRESPTSRPQRRLSISRNLAPDRGNADRGLRDGCLRDHVGLDCPSAGRNARSVWTITPRPYRGAHFATMPPALAERCIKAGSAPGDTVLDPFAGSGTTGAEAVKLGRSFVGVELNPAYLALARHRIADESLPLIDTPKEVTA
jgi:DNA modification methylase